jgi:hypothetical protein
MVLNSQYKNIAPLFLFHIPLHGPIEPILWYKIFKQKVGILFLKCSLVLSPIFL